MPLTSIALAATLHAAPVKLILDTDMGNDVDDVQALAMIHALQSRGLVDLIAVTSSKDHPLSAPFIDAVNTFYGRPDIPIGAVRDGATKDERKFLGIADDKYQDGKFTYPHDLLSGTDAPEAVSLLRKTLAAQADGSVSIAQIGFFTNLTRLLNSPADSISPLTGKELIAKKVTQLVVMAGAFDKGGKWEKHREFNVREDIPSAQALTNNWPGTIVWSGFEVGISARYPAASVQEDYNYTPHHIVKEAYTAYCGIDGENPTYDLTCPLFIVHPDRGYFDLSEPGIITVKNDGTTTFSPDPSGNHRYLKTSTIQSARIVETFTQLCPVPPALHTTQVSH